MDIGKAKLNITDTILVEARSQFATSFARTMRSYSLCEHACHAVSSLA